MTKLTDKRATMALLTGQLRGVETDLKDERESVRALASNLDAARARVADLENQVVILKELMEHLQ